VPISGRARGDAPDVSHPWLSIEAKSRKEIPLWLEEAMKQAEACASPSQLPVAVLHRHGQQARQALVVLRLGDWLDWFGTGG
jgi:hypothetical protein